MTPAHGRPGHAPAGAPSSRAARQAALVLALLAAFAVQAQVPNPEKDAVGPASNESPRKLEPVEITGKKTEGYTVTNASTATKTDTPLIETPVSVQVIPRQVLDDQKATTLDEALSNVAGVRASSIGWAETIYLRGFSTSTYFRDGFRIDDPSGLGGQAKLSNVESIEVLKGPGAILYGRVEPGGVVNLVTKQPQPVAAHSAEASVGSWNQYAANVDTTGPVGADRTLLYRLNVAYDKSRFWVDNVRSESAFIAPTITWRPSERTAATFEASYLHDRTTLYQQAVVPFDTATNTFQWGPRNANPAPYYFDPDTTFVGVNWSHAFDDDWVVRQKISHNRVDFSTPLNLSTAFGPLQLINDAWTVSLGSAQLTGHTQSDGTVVDLTGHVVTGPVRHTLLVGADYYRLVAFYDSRYSNPAGPFIDVPLFSSQVVSPAGIPLDPDTFYMTQTVTHSYGVYAQDQAKLPGGVELLGGLRYQSVSSSGYTSAGANFGGSGAPEAQPETHDTAVTPRAAVLWQPDQRLSFYTSYTKNFGASNAANGTDWQGHALKPESARQYEAGAKAELPDRKASASFAWFDLTKTNVAAPDLAHPNGAGGFFPTTVGEIESRGIEFTVQGEFAPGWDGVFAYTHDHAFVKVGTSLYPQGSDVPNVPKDMARLFSTYRFRAGAIAGVKVGAGMTWEGPAAGTFVDPNTFATDTSTIKSPAYVIFDAVSSYETTFGRDKASFQVNVKNLFNRRYYTDAFMFLAPWGYVTYGAPRSVVASVKVDF